MSNICPKMAEKDRKKLRKVIQKSIDRQEMSYTTDFWYSKAQKRDFIAVNVHFFHDEQSK